jgi:hypothetical protein
MRMGYTLVVLLQCSALLAAAPATPSLKALCINTEPTGASITIDGNKCGVAPTTISNLTAGDHLVVATLTGYETTRRTASLGEEDQHAVAVDLKLEPILGLVLIHTDPAGAEIQIDGADRGKTPLFLSDVPIGKHRVRLSVSGYQSKEIDLAIKDRTPQKISISLASDSAKIILDSEPTGANVVLNGIAKGKTPCTLDRIPAGDARLELSLDGFTPYEQTIKLVAGQEEKLQAVLKPIPAELTVVSIPEKARIYVNDLFRGEAPVTLKSLAPGSYRVRAELKGYETEARTLELKQAQQLPEEFRLAKNSGILEIVTEPAEVKVFIDGEDAGITGAQANEAGALSAPLQIDLLSPGPHQIQLTKNGYFNKAITVEIAKDKTAALHEVLSRRFIPDYQVTTATEAYHGILIEKDPLGNIKLEIKPGVFKTIPAKDVRTCIPLKDKQEPKEPDLKDAPDDN